MMRSGIDLQGYLMTNKWFKDSKAAYELDQEGHIKRMVKKITRVNNEFTIH